MTTKEAIEVLEVVLSLINVNYIGMLSDVQRSLDKSVAVLSNKYNLNGRKEREDLIRHLKKLSCELPPKSFVLSKVLPDNLNKALCKAIEVMEEKKECQQ